MKNPIKFQAYLATISLMLLGASLSVLSGPSTATRRGRVFDEVDIDEAVALQGVEPSSDESDLANNYPAASSVGSKRRNLVVDEQSDEDEEDDNDSAASDMSQEALARLGGQWNFPSGHNLNHPSQVVEATELDGDTNLPLDTNIENAKLELGTQELMAAAGHHHHHKHYPHGKMEMGAHTGKKGAFGWHSKHPVGGKGR